jgi:dTMP kinase
VRVAELLSGLPLQTIAQAEARPKPAPAAPISPDGQHATAPHHPHAQTGPTPQLHP